MRGEGNAERVGDIKTAYKILFGKLKVWDHSEDIGIDGRIILEWILRKQD